MYDDVLKLSRTCKLMHQLLTKAKVFKKVVRFGNLNKNLRAKFWREISE